MRHIVSRKIKLAYIPQIPWVFSGTVMRTFCLVFHSTRKCFQNIVDTCGLMKDLAAFTNGDMAEVGQRVVTPSGGQKGLARAVHSDAGRYLLDDPLSSVDIKVGRRSFEACIVGHLSGRIRLLVRVIVLFYPRSSENI